MNRRQFLAKLGLVALAAPAAAKAVAEGVALAEAAVEPHEPPPAFQDIPQQPWRELVALGRRRGKSEAANLTVEELLRINDEIIVHRARLDATSVAMRGVREQAYGFAGDPDTGWYAGSEPVTDVVIGPIPEAQSVPNCKVWLKGDDGQMYALAGVTGVRLNNLTDVTLWPAAEPVRYTYGALADLPTVTVNYAHDQRRELVAERLRAPAPVENPVMPGDTVVTYRRVGAPDHRPQPRGHVLVRGDDGHAYWIPQGEQL